MSIHLCQHNSDKVSLDDSSASLSSSPSLHQLETAIHQSDTFRDTSLQKGERPSKNQNKEALHRRCSSSSLTRISSSYADASIPAFVYIPIAFSPSSPSINDEASSSSEEDLDIIRLSHEFHHWQAFPNMSDVKRNTTWGIITATVNDVVAEEQLQLVKMDYFSPSEASPIRQPKPPLSHCSLSTSSLLVV
ncbi:hypothetical protein FisN_5Hu261 [Fistulifera solaris]|uniref:Uncharacterized protein n=1 Tax=Fistulifera solaris TaxID=1519565 RepID=A0A1Z5JS88_FISSO|nr:hypothetical protein FisN_5Hu261 [Fistulifera solaris]|eukprot:GAX16887.1 hypothetical protein FisN_5Hu261 [Fistulifera solaris]